MKHNIFDAAFSSMSGIDMYRGWVMPEGYPEVRRARLENWDPDDLIAYVGGEYAK